MITISRSALLPHTGPQIFELVNDIEAYPQFMDGCVDATILRHEGQLLEARLDLSKAGMTQSLITRNTSVGMESIILELVEGPFEFFEGRWGFQTLGDSACKVSLHIEFAINSSVLGAAAGKLFERVSNKLVESVSQRAKIIYG